jgi:hypothetical protein
VLAVVGAAALSVLVGATAYAAIPDAGTAVFHGCVGKRTGVLRVIDPSAGGRCSTIRGLEETPIQWNQTGPAGPPGPVGSPGPAGGTELTDTRTASATLTSSQMITVAAECDPGDVPVNGYWTVNGESGIGHQAVFYSLGPTGETATGYQVVVSRNSSYSGADPVVTATVICLNTA